MLCFSQNLPLLSLREGVISLFITVNTSTFKDRKKAFRKAFLVLYVCNTPLEQYERRLAFLYHDYSNKNTKNISL